MLYIRSARLPRAEPRDYDRPSRNVFPRVYKHAVPPFHSFSLLKIYQFPAKTNRLNVKGAIKMTPNKNYITPECKFLKLFF